jgi:hypothetical protein
MPLILAIEPDHQQAELLASVFPQPVNAELLLVPSVERALRVLETRVPDLLLTPLLLSARDDAALTGRVRELDDRGIAVPILVIPVLSAEPAAAEPVQRAGGLMTFIRRPKAVAAAPSKGCRPEVFAEQIYEYLARAAAERSDREALAAPSTWKPTEAAATAPLLAELLPLQPTQEPVARFQEPEDSSPLGDLQADQDRAILNTVAEALPEAVTADVEELPPASASAIAGPVEPMVDAPIEIAPSLLPGQALDDLNVESEVIMASTIEHAMETVPADIDALPAMVAAADSPAVAEPIDLSDKASEPREGDVAAHENDEIWMPLPVPAAQYMAPIEGPSLKGRAPVRRLRSRKAEATTAQPAKPAGPKRARKAPKPMQDEWGLYDPEQCGFAALLERLEEMTGKSKRPA